MGENDGKTGGLTAWLRAVGFFRGFWLVSLVPVSLGGIVAWWETKLFAPGIFALTLAAVWAVHIGTNLINEYYDHLSGTDDINKIRTPFSGGTRVIQENLLLPGPIKIAGYAAFAVGGILLVILAWLIGWPILALAALGIFSGIAYSAKPVWLAYKGFGEFLIGLNFGPFLVITAYYAQAQTVSPAAITAGLIMGALSAAIITINEVPDYEADKKVGKNNLVVRKGIAFGVKLWGVLLWSSLLIAGAGVILRVFPVQALAVLVMAVPIYLLTRNAQKDIHDLPYLISRCRFTIMSQLGVWILLCATFLYSGWRGA